MQPSHRKRIAWCIRRYDVVRIVPILLLALGAGQPLDEGTRDIVVGPSVDALFGYCIELVLKNTVQASHQPR